MDWDGSLSDTRRQLKDAGGPWDAELKWISIPDSCGCSSPKDFAEDLETGRESFVNVRDTRSARGEDASASPCFIAHILMAGKDHRYDCIAFEPLVDFYRPSLSGY
jgi:hypothetical protein